MPNAIAYLVLALWPFVCLVLFRTLTLQRALIWSILGGYLVLPPLTEFNLPLVPAMDKVSVPNLSVLAILIFATKERVHLWPDSRLARWLMVGFVLCVIPTVLTNSEAINFEVLRGADPIVFLIDQLPGQSVRDIGSVLIAQLLTLVPFVLARQFLATDEGLRDLLLAFMIGGLIYSIPSLIEIRLSPQMNIWVYGFFQHSFEQMMREGGFRPIVFLPHGLWLALFVCIALMSGAALTRAAAPGTRARMLILTAYLAVLLFLCKSLASFAYGLVLTPFIFFASHRMMIRLALVFGLTAVIYPTLRQFQLIPTDAILEQVAAVKPERAESLEYRFNNEAQLLVRAAEKPLFGWGGWGRSLIRDDETGRIMSIPDGRWIVVFGTFGWLGYICEFGLLALPIFLMGWEIRRRRDLVLPPYVGPAALILGITMMDMLLNATLTPITWLTAGAILGHAERLARIAGPVHRRFSTPPVIGGAPAGSRDGKRTVL